MKALLSLAAGLMLALAGSAEAATWHIDMVDQSGAGRFSSLKVDTNGNVHVAYVVDDGNRYPLRYGFWDHALKKWFIMTVAEGVGTCSLALDSKQRPHISYVDYGSASGSKLRYAYWDGAIWKRQPIPLNSDIISYYCSIVLDAKDRPTLSFYEYRGPKDTDFKIRLRTVAWNGQYWQVRTVDGEEGSGKFNAMTIDPQGNIHIAYANVGATTAGMRYAYGNGETWKLEVLEGLAQNNGGMVGYSSCIALDKEGNPHVSYVNESTSLVKYAVRRAGRWQIEAVDRLSRIGYPDRNSIAIDDQGRPYIAYYDAGRGILKVAHREGQKWVAEIVDSNASGFTPSLQIDQGNIWISYADESNGGVKVAHSELEAGGVSAAAEAIQTKK